MRQAKLSQNVAIFNESIGEGGEVVQKCFGTIEINMPLNSL